jgi:predicted nucleic acid binding AN1-type Zn finger protein
MVNGKKKYINQSNVIHVALPSKCTNIKSVKSTTSKLTLKKGSKKTLTVKTTYANSKKQLVNHMKPMIYQTTNAKVATVNAKGTIVAKGKGTCYVYVSAYSGAYTKVKVTVK